MVRLQQLQLEREGERESVPTVPTASSSSKTLVRPAPIAKCRPTQAACGVHCASEDLAQPEVSPFVHRHAELRQLVASNYGYARNNPSLCDHLKQHCCLCLQWVADTRHIKQHHKKSHPELAAGLIQKAITVCATFASGMTVPCPYCGVAVERSNVPRHARSCTVLYQLALSVTVAQHAGHVPQSSGEGHLWTTVAAGRSGDPGAGGHTEAGRRAEAQGIATGKRVAPVAQVAPQGERGQGEGKGTGIRAWFGGGRGPPASSDCTASTASRGCHIHSASRQGHAVLPEDRGAGILPANVVQSQAWNKEREKPIAQRQEPLSPLRIVLVKAFLSEMAARITKVTEDPEVRKKVIAAGWATQEADQTLSWHFQMYDAEKKQEHVDQSKPPLPHARIMQLLEGVAESLRPEVVQRFHATRPQAESYQGPVVVFMMEVAHRGEYAKVLYRNMADLAHNMVWNLMASRMRLETIGRSPLANRIAQLLADQSEPCV